jgi:hypothetical protein
MLARGRGLECGVRLLSLLGFRFVIRFPLCHLQISKELGVFSLDLIPTCVFGQSWIVLQGFDETLSGKLLFLGGAGFDFGVPSLDLPFLVNGLALLNTLTSPTILQNSEKPNGDRLNVRISMQRFLHGFPCELTMKGPARLTACASPFSARNFTSQARWTLARASGAFPPLCAAS